MPVKEISKFSEVTLISILYIHGELHELWLHPKSPQIAHKKFLWPGCKIIITKEGG